MSTRTRTRAHCAHPALSTKQRKALARKARLQRAREAERRRRRNHYLAGAGFGVLVVAIFIAAALGLLPGPRGPYEGLAISKICYPSEPHAYDVHVQLDIEITEDDGTTNQVQVPRDFGAEADCVHVIHTHDDSGELHVHMEQYRRVNLGDFFAIWEQPFNATTLFDRVVDDDHVLEVKVDDQPDGQYEKLELKANQRIEIHFGPVG